MPDTVSTQCDADLAALTALGQLATEHPELAELTTLTFSADGVHGTPWLFCRPITALLTWVKALPGETIVQPVDLGETGTRLTATSKFPNGRPLYLSVITHARNADGNGRHLTPADLELLAAAEAEPPDLSQPLPTELIRAPFAPMPALSDEPEEVVETSPENARA